MQSRVEDTTATVVTRIKKKREKIKNIRLSVEQRKEVIQKETANCDQVFTALEDCIKRNKTWLHEVMEEKQKTAEKEAEGVYQSLCELPPTKDWPCISTNTDVHVKPQRKALMKMVNDIDMEMEKIPGIMLKSIQRYGVDVTLDPNTANPYLSLSDDGKRVENAVIPQQFPKGPERFTNYKAVLGKNGFSSGKFYYEVMVKGNTEWSLGVARGSIERIKSIKATPESGLWIVRLRRGKEYKAYVAPPVPLSLKHKPQKVGVFVDYEEGMVSFYDVTAKSHIYSFTGQSFTEKLYPYFSPCLDRDSRNKAPLIITPVERMK
ncbi:E3 ubiquitin-protein ligase TRIM39-like [Chanos chanos]|uniref:E3 ubiquitin-protein ligase TRIM39-like n=1 Tax=Chanos chanos TaxID=29144 RepID=A0A6J2VTB2_CHACN|nr:E3 ubiquitin-protein ligase TRIM39-like [Chanos chanos]